MITRIRRDPAERETLIDNALFANGSESNPIETDTALTYDAAGNILTRKTDAAWNRATGAWSEAPKQTSFEYDRLDRETKMTVTPATGPGRTTTSTYYGSGPMKSRTKKNGVVESWFYDLDGRINQMNRLRGGADHHDKNQHYDYDRNGNRVQDERGTYLYNGRDQLVRWKRGATARDPGTTVDYTVDGSGNVIEKVDSSEEDANDRTRPSSTAVPATPTASARSPLPKG